MAPLGKLYLQFSTSVTEKYKYSVNPTSAFVEKNAQSPYILIYIVS